MIPASVRHDIVAHARHEAPREACGLAVRTPTGGWLLRRARNVHPEPEHHFELDRETAAAVARARAEVVFYYHSHPTGSADPSEADRRALERLGAWGLVYGVAEERFASFHPATAWRSIRGRRWSWETSNCYDAVRSVFERCYGLGLPAFPMPPPAAFPRPGAPHFRRRCEAAGFRQLARGVPLCVGDVVSFRLVRREEIAEDHLGVLIGDSAFFHHRIGELARDEDFSLPWRRRVAWAYRHRGLEAQGRCRPTGVVI